MSNAICLVGEVIVDLTLNPIHKIRLGGIMHAARALWAIGETYDLLYIAPTYLRKQIEKFGKCYGAANIVCIGEVTGAPNLILINEAKEVGNQGYQLILSEEHEVNYLSSNAITYVESSTYSDVLFFSGQYNLSNVVNFFTGSSARLHADIANNFTTIESLADCGVQFDTLITSTSSDLFLNQFNADVDLIKNSLLAKYCSAFLFKQNRGGSDLYLSSGAYFTVGAQIRRIAHSVGVGDCFDAIFVSMIRQGDLDEALNLSSWISADYATTSFPDDFKQLVANTRKLTKDYLSENRGIYLAWNKRKKINIYLAAPDFDFKDTTYIDVVYKALNYHNFSPRRPVRENGQMEHNASISRRQDLYDADMIILNQCSIVVAILTENDPGTLVEIGVASALKMPVLLFDPLKIASNCMLTQSCHAVFNSVDDLIDEIFNLSSKQNGFS